MPRPNRRILLSAAGALAVLAAAGTLVGSAWNLYVERQERDLHLGSTETAVRMRERAAQAQIDLVDALHDRYAQLEAAGAFRVMDKAVEIDRAEARLRPYAVQVTRYQIGGTIDEAMATNAAAQVSAAPPAPVDPSAASASAPAFELETQRALVEFEPLHEGRFLQVWGAISELRGTLGAVDSCRLERNETAPTQGAVAQGATLKARCVLSWYRLRPPSVNPDTPAAPLAPNAS